MGLYLLQQTVLHIPTHAQSSFQYIFMFWMIPHGDMDHGCLWREELYFVCSSITCFLKVTGTCTHLMEREFHEILLSCVFAAMRQILRGKSHKLQSNQLKTRKNFLPQWGIEPGPFCPKSSALPWEPSSLHFLIWYLKSYTNVFDKDKHVSAT